MNDRIGKLRIIKELWRIKTGNKPASIEYVIDRIKDELVEVNDEENRNYMTRRYGVEYEKCSCCGTYVIKSKNRGK